MPVDPEDLTNAMRILAAGTPNKFVGESESPLSKYVLSPLGKTLDVLDTDLNLVTQAIKPLAVGMNPSLEEVYNTKGFNTVPSDLIEKAIPGKTPLKGVLGFLLDVGLSPTTYITGVGGLTKAAKVAKAAAATKEAGLTIQSGSKLAKGIEKFYGPGVKGLEAAQKGLAPSLTEQAARGQRALISIGIPFTGKEKSVMDSWGIISRIGDTANALKKSHVGIAFEKIFSTTSGNPEFDKLRTRFISLARMRQDEVLGKATNYAKETRKLAKELNMPYEDLDKTIFNLVENPIYGSITADVLRASNLSKITDWKLYANGEADKVIKSFLGYYSLSIHEKGKLHRQITRELLAQQNGINVYTAGLRLLTPESIDKFADIFTKQSGMTLLKDIKRRGGVYKMVSTSDMMRNYLNGVKTKFGFLSGDDAVAYSMVGPKEYKRIKDIQLNLDKLHGTPQFKILPAAIQLGTGTEYKQAVTVGRQILGHVDTQFTLHHALYRTNPEYLKKVNPVVHDMFTKIYADPTWKIDALVEQFKITKELAGKYPELFDAAQSMRRLTQSQLLREQISGLPTGSLIADINYLAHIPTKEVREFLSSRVGFKGAARQWTPDHANMLQREFRRIDNLRLNEAYNSNYITRKQFNSIRSRGMDAVDDLIKANKISLETSARFVHTLTAEEVNLLAKQDKLKILGGLKVDRFFDINPSNAFRVRSARGENARTAQEFFDAIKENGFGVAIPKSGYIPAGMKSVSAKGLEGLMFDQRVAEHIDKYWDGVSMPVGAHPFLTIFDRMQDAWKAWTLAPWPMYHTRNWIGNMWNNFLAGMGPKEIPHYNMATNIQHAAGEFLFKGMKTLDEIESTPEIVNKLSKIKLTLASGQVVTGIDIVKNAKEQGILNIGQFWGDVAHYFEADAKDVIHHAVNNPIITGGLRTGNYVQNNANLAHYIWRLKEGDGWVEAARSVKKYQFDYTDLTDVERDIFRRVLPFYSWTRKNVPLQIEAMLTQPAKPMGVLKVKNAVESDADGIPDERLLPDWMVRSFPVRVRFNQQSKNYEYFLLGGWLPLTDIDRLFEPGKMAANMLSPVIKEPFQQLANRDFFFGKDIDSGGEYERIAGINMPVRVAHVLKNIRAINESKKWTDEDYTLETKIASLVTGKRYPFVQEKERVARQIEYSKRQSNLNRLLKRAEAKGDTQEITRIINELEALAYKQAEIE